MAKYTIKGAMLGHDRFDFATGTFSSVSEAIVFMKQHLITTERKPDWPGRIFIAYAVQKKTLFGSRIVVADVYEVTAGDR